MPIALLAKGVLWHNYCTGIIYALKQLMHWCNFYIGIIYTLVQFMHRYDLCISKSDVTKLITDVCYKSFNKLECP
jgi:hypothetical protein